MTFLTVAVIACNEEGAEALTVLPSSEGEGVSPAQIFQAEATLVSRSKTTIYTIPRSIDHEFEGTGQADNGEAFTLKLSHLESDEGASFEIYNGYFTLTNGSGHELNGRYVGNGLRGEGSFAMSQVWSIQKAEGDYAHIRGELTAEFTDVDNDGVLEVYIAESIR